MKAGFFWLMIIGTAWAGSDYAKFLETPPCSDGWAECVVDGSVVGIGDQQKKGIQYNNNARVDFWTFKPLAQVSPFPVYEDFPELEVKIETKPETKTQTRSETRTQTETRQETKTETQIETKTEIIPETIPETVTETKTETQTEVPVETGCSDLEELEDVAMLGSLSSKQVNCLEDKIKSTSKQTGKQKISVVLINNAQASKNWKKWERYTKRHLDKYDRSDANMCLGFAIYMYNKRRFSNAIIWSVRALENKQKFSSGNDYTKKVYQLHQLKTMSANSLWTSSEKKLVTLQDDTKREKEEEKVEKYKAKTKNFAREWLDFARANGQSDSRPMQLCVSAADKDFCQ